MLEREVERGTPFNCVPVAMAAGILAYFTLPFEPAAWIAPLACTGTLLVVVWRRGRGFGFYLSACIAVLCMGAVSAQLRTHAVEAPTITRPVTTQLRGLVIETQRNRRGSPRYVISVTEIAGFPASALPKRVRLSAASSHEPLKPGEFIAGRARLQPLSGPAMPLGFDFGFFHYYAGLGGTGWFMGAPVRNEGDIEVFPWPIRLAVRINSARDTVAGRLRAGMEGEFGDLAVALVTGDQTGLDDETLESLRVTGLAHVLSISGFHMALVTLTVMATIRFILSFVPPLVLRFPIRKWAAVAGLLAASVYLLLSGAAVATQRSYIMVVVMLFAVLIDRKALTMRNVAIAAILVLLTMPESLLGPGFQMSFAATAALVAAYDLVRQRRNTKGWRPPDRGLPGRILAGSLVYLGGLAFTSLVAGFATGLFAAWHFHRIAPLGLIANLLAMPVISFVTMPLILVGMILMAFGQEAWALPLVEISLAAVMAISDWTAAWPLPDVTGALPASVLLLSSVGLVVIVLLSTRLRWLGLVPIALAMTQTGSMQPPLLVISQDGSTLAVTDSQGRLALAYPRRNRFSSEIWLRAWSGEIAGARDEVYGRCDRDLCLASTADGIRIAVVRAPREITAACLYADILVAPRLRWIRCPAKQPAVILRRSDFDAGGMHVVQIDRRHLPPHFEVEAAIRHPSRPWNVARTAPPLLPDQ